MSPTPTEATIQSWSWRDMTAQYENGLLDPAFLTHQQRVLSRMLVDEERRLNAILADVGNTSGQASRAQGANEPGELAQLLVERLNGVTLGEQTRARIEEIGAALQRIENGSYGGCVRCTRPIDSDRLEALPEVALCAACKTAPGEASQLRSLSVRTR